MAIRRRQLHFRSKGTMGQTEDWFTLHFDEESKELYVEHSWSHTNIGRGPSDNGEQSYSIAEFLKLENMAANTAQGLLMGLIDEMIGKQDA